MTPTEVLKALGEPGSSDNISLDWDRSERGNSQPGFLVQRQIIESLEWCGFTHAHENILIETAREITRSPALCRLARHCKWCLFDNPKPYELSGWPTLDISLGKRAGHFYLLVALGMVPHVREYHAKLGIPEEITRGTCGQIREFCDIYQQDQSGFAGLPFRRVSWLRHYVREPYFRVGRLEYWLKPNPVPPLVYRSTKSGQVIALAWEGAKLTPEGVICSDESNDEWWQSTYSETDQEVTGYPISPAAKVLRERIRLPRSEWQPVLAPGSPVLQVHIPSGDPLTPAAALASKTDAVAFFERHFPDVTPCAFVSTSWLFSDLLESMLSATSNVVRYLQELYLFPVGSGKHSGLSFIFPHDLPFNPETASRKTALQRAILDHLTDGHRWRIGGMFMMLDDLKHYGSRHYRSTWQLSDFSRLGH